MGMLAWAGVVTALVLVANVLLHYVEHSLPPLQ